MTIPDITFINPPSSFLEESLWVYPLGVLNIATYTKSLGYAVDFIDLAPLTSKFNNDADLESEVSKIINGIKSPYIGVTGVTSHYKFIELLPKLCKDKTKKFIAGGAHTTLFPKEVLGLGYEAVVVGEGELVIDKILKGFKGIHQSSEIVDINTLPFPERTFFKGYKGPTPVMAGRGCPFTCTFCAKIDGSNKTRFRDVEKVVAEIKTIENDRIIFYDDTFTLKHKWVEELCSLIKKENIKKIFRCSTRADRFTLELATMLKEAGFDEICVGVESGSQQILDILNKRTKVDDNTKALQICKQVGLKFKAFIMLGNPGESKETLEETWDWINDNQPEKLGMYIFNPLPGADIWNNPQNYDIQFEKKGFSQCYYGGRRNEIIANVATSKLSSEDITNTYRKFLHDFKHLLI